MFSEAKRSLPSKAAAVVFNRAEGWTPSKSRKWLVSHGIAKPTKYRTMISKGGDILAPGSYIRIPVLPEKQLKSFTSFGYLPESVNYPGVYFQVGGHRGGKRKAREAFSGTKRVRAIDTDLAHIESCTSLNDVIDMIGNDWRDEPVIAIYSDASVATTKLGDAAADMCSGKVARDHLGASGRYWVEYVVNKDQRKSGPWMNKGQIDRVEKRLGYYGFPVVAKYEQKNGERVDFPIATGKVDPDEPGLFWA